MFYFFEYYNLFYVGNAYSLKYIVVKFQFTVFILRKQQLIIFLFRKTTSCLENVC